MVTGISGGAAAATASVNKTESAQSLASLAENFDQFLQLFVTQLKNQDPLDPEDPSETAARLAQYTGVQQQVKTNQFLERIIASNEARQNADLSNYLGKTVEVKSNNIYFDGQNNPLISYTVPKAAESTKITISDPQGKVIFTANGTTTSGTHHANLDFSGLKTGNYNVKVEASYENQADPEALEVHTTGFVEAVSAKDGKSKLVINGLETDPSDIVALTASATNSNSFSSIGELAAFIGKNVTVANASIVGADSKISYALPTGARNVTISVFNAKNQEVLKTTASSTASLHEYTWDGKDNQGSLLANGNYYVKVSYTDVNSAKQDVLVTQTGEAKAVTYANGLAYLEVNGSAVPGSAIIKVTN